MEELGITFFGVWLFVVIVKLFGGFKFLSWNLVILIPVIRFVINWILMPIIVFGFIYLFYWAYH